MLGNGPVRFGGRPHGKGPAQRAPRRAAHPVQLQGPSRLRRRPRRHVGNQQFRRQPAAGRAVIAVVSHLCGTVGWVVTQIGPAQCCDLASPTATPTATARSGCWSRTADIRSPWTPDTWRPDTWGARNWDIDIEVEVDVDDIRDINRQPRIDVHGRRWRKFAYNRSEVPVHARRARRWWWLSAADRR